MHIYRKVEINCLCLLWLHFKLAFHDYGPGLLITDKLFIPVHTSLKQHNPVLFKEMVAHTNSSFCFYLCWHTDEQRAVTVWCFCSVVMEPH